MKNLIKLATAKLAKEVMFNEKTTHFFIVDLEGNSDGLTHIDGKRKLSGAKWNSQVPTRIAAPTQSELESWLWDNYKIFIEITLWGDGIGFTGILKYMNGKEEDGTDIVYGDPEDVKNSNSDLYALKELMLVKALNKIK